MSRVLKLEEESLMTYALLVMLLWLSEVAKNQQALIMKVKVHGGQKWD